MSASVKLEIHYKCNKRTIKSICDFYKSSLLVVGLKSHFLSDWYIIFHHNKQE